MLTAAGLTRVIGRAYCQHQQGKLLSLSLSCRSSAAPRLALLPTHALSTAMEDAPKTKSKVAVAQMTSVGDPDANYEQCASLAREAAAQGCSLLCLPECCSFIGRSGAEAVDVMQPLEGGSYMRRFKDLARDTGVWLSLGGFQKSGPDPAHLYNSHVIVDDQGSIQASYDKIHLFSVDLPDVKLKESNSTAPGSEVVAVDSPVGRLGLTVCYDLRFPYLYQLLRFKHGAQVILVPSAFTKPTGEAHWEALLRARAIETQCYVIAAAQAGTHNEKRESYGHALIIDPWGAVVGRLDDPDATGIAVAEVDLEYLASVRERMPIEQHRVPGVLGVMEP